MVYAVDEQGAFGMVVGGIFDVKGSSAEPLAFVLGSRTAFYRLSFTTIGTSSQVASVQANTNMPYDFREYYLPDTTISTLNAAAMH